MTGFKGAVIASSVGAILAATVPVGATGLDELRQPANLAVPASQARPQNLEVDRVLVASQIALGRFEAEAQSIENPALSCRLTIKLEAEDTARLTWTSEGAVALGISPLSFSEGMKPAGEQVVPAVPFSRFHMTAKDIDGNLVRCSIVLPGRVIEMDSLSNPVPADVGAAPAPAVAT